MNITAEDSRHNRERINQIEQKINLLEQKTESISPADIKALIIETVREMGLTSTTEPAASKQYKQERDEPDWDAMSNSELWEFGRKGSAYHKVGRSFKAIIVWNSEHAFGDSQRIAPNNQALRALAGVNGQVVSAWMSDHKTDVIDSYRKHGLENRKQPDSLATYANKGKPIESILDAIKREVLGV